MEVQKEEDDLASSMHVSRSKLGAAWKDVEKSVGRQVRVDLGNSTKWTIVSFKLALVHLVATAPAFQQLLRETWIHRPCSRRDPWSVIVYGDEIVPGSVLRPENHRKLFCWYAAIKELGPQKTKHEICWIPLAVLRSGKMKEDTGGVSVATEVLLRETFVQDGLATEGGCLDLQAPGGGFVQLFFVLGNIVADADGHRAMWSVKGSSGKLPCPCCLNVVNDEHLPAAVETTRLVSMTSTDPRKFRLAQDADWFSKADMLASRKGAMTKSAFKELQTAVGLTYVANGLLWSAPLRHVLRPTHTFTYDSMHCILSNGIANTEVDAMVEKLRQDGITFEDLDRFMALPWQSCKSFWIKKTATTCFSTARKSRSTKVDACDSEPRRC